jgi:CoA:oxalate CoA-transferase
MATIASGTVQHDALQDIVVLDFTFVMSGPLCTRTLADAGAEVIKVEAPGGDLMRQQDPMINGVSTYFGALNCGKKSIELDLATSEGKEAALRLAERADVLVENFRPGVMARLGLDYETLRKINPRLIYCSISGYGQQGPKSGVPAYAPIMHAASGYDDACMGFEGASQPPTSGIMIADVLAGVHAASAIHLALFDRERTGKGQHVDVALFDCMLGMLIRETLEAQIPTSHPYGGFHPVKAKDGYLMIAAVTDRNGAALFDVIGRPELNQDPRFSSASARLRNRPALCKCVEAWTLQHSARECEEVLMAAGVPVSRYKTAAEAIDDPQTVSRGTMQTLPCSGGSFRVVNAPYRMSRARVEARPLLPSLGEHGTAVLQDLLAWERERAFSFAPPPDAAGVSARVCLVDGISP